jgi:nicotinate-nucleotide adenylyltransferase
MTGSDVTALFGGGFDPPHLGHREAVRGLFGLPGVTRVWVIPSATPPHKPSHCPAEHRLAMASIGFQSTPQDPLPEEIEILSVEIDRARATGRPSYSYDTLQELKPRNSKLAFVIGADQLAALPTWYRFPEVLELTNWIVLERKPGGSELARKTLSEWESSQLIAKDRPTDQGLPTWKLRNPRNSLILAPTEAPALSSTAIRESLGRSGQAPAQSLLPEVLAYILRHKLYGVLDQNVRQGGQNDY